MATLSVTPAAPFVAQYPADSRKIGNCLGKPPIQHD